MKLDDTLRTYRRYAGFYDIVFGAVFASGRREAVRRVNDRPNQRILEVGVGTGLSLPLFRADARVTGIDVSPEMLDKAREKVTRLRLTQVEMIREMDAERLDFAADSFDAVLALYVVSVVSDPARFGAEIRRVCRPGGRIVIVNHFSSEAGPMRRLEQALAPFAGKIGFHADFPLDRFLAASGFTVAERKPVNLLGYWTLLVCVNEWP
jgi:phosphatidylethanolamine/phosphatidyl-N-methylethanolamine N-methyltransferase